MKRAPDIMRVGVLSECRPRFGTVCSVFQSRFDVRTKPILNRLSCFLCRIVASHNCACSKLLVVSVPSRPFTKSPSKFAATVSLASVRPLAAISSTERRMRVASGWAASQFSAACEPAVGCIELDADVIHADAAMNTAVHIGLSDDEDSRPSRMNSRISGVITTISVPRRRIFTSGSHRCRRPWP